jgi:hypothetical protein
MTKAKTMITTTKATSSKRRNHQEPELALWLYPFKDHNMQLKELVFEALTNAKNGGYFNIEEPNGMLYWGDLAIADDLLTYHDELAGYQPTALIPFIRQWRSLNQCEQLTPNTTDETKPDSKSMSLEQLQTLLNPLNRL